MIVAGNRGLSPVLFDYHPHVHLVMPAAAVDRERGQWRTKRRGYLFKHKAWARVFRAKMRRAASMVMMSGSRWARGGLINPGATQGLRSTCMV